MSKGHLSHIPVLCRPDTGEFTLLFGNGTDQWWSLAIDGKYLD